MKTFPFIEHHGTASFVVEAVTDTSTGRYFWHRAFDGSWAKFFKPWR